MSDLPTGWRWARFSEVAAVASNLVDPRATPDAIHIAPNHIESWSGVLIGRGTVESDDVKSSKHAFRPGQILYSKIRPYLAKAVLVDFPGVCSADMYPIEADRSILDPRFLLAWLLTPEFTEAASRQQGRTVLPKINQSALNQLPVPVPPLEDQRRIVAKLDALRARSRRAKEALDAVPALLDRLRQSILAAAFRGDLTADWREQNPDVEPASELLKHIRIERRKRWEEAQLAKMLAKGKPPKDDRWKPKYVEPQPVDDADLPELPPGWCWASLSEVAELQLGQRRAPEFKNCPEFKYIRAANITWDGLDLRDVKTMGFDRPDDLFLRPGDVLLNEASGSPTEVGKPAIWRGEIERCCFQATVLRVRFISSLANGDWIHTSLLADARLGRFAAMAPGVGILHLTAERMRNWPVPLAPAPEQELLVSRVRGALARTSQLVEALSAARSTHAELDRAILAAAFRGELTERPSEAPSSLLPASP